MFLLCFEKMKKLHLIQDQMTMRGEISEAPRQQWSNVSRPTLKTVKYEHYFSSALTHHAVIVSLSL